MRPVKLVFIAPGRQDLFDYPAMSGAISPPIESVLRRTATARAHHDADSLRAIAAVDLIADAAHEEDDIAAAVWACTSGSFVLGRAGSERQALELGSRLRTQASSTSLGFVHALKSLDVQQVAIASPYPEPVTQLLAEYLVEYEIEVVATASYGAATGYDSYVLDQTAVTELVERADSPSAQAVLLPDTAVQAALFINDIEALIDKPLLAANQVTLWEALRLSGMAWQSAGPGRLLTSPQPELSAFKRKAQP